MPIYEYCCNGCHQHIELLVRGDEQVSCPECGSLELQKQFSVPAAHISGMSSLPVCSPLPMSGGPMSGG